MLPVLSEALITAILYLWSMFNKEQIVTFMYGMQFRVSGYAEHPECHECCMLKDGVSGRLSPLGSGSA